MDGLPKAVCLACQPSASLLHALMQSLLPAGVQPALLLLFSSVKWFLLYLLVKVGCVSLW